jgi:EmrB/QacA subfamily drug resistance transporter
MTENDPRRWWALPVVLSASCLALFDLFVTNVAAPSIQRDLGAGSGGLEGVVAGYSFTYAIGLISGGRLGDLLGRRRVFLFGMVVFTVAAGLCGAAPSTGALLAARLLQGLGAALMVPQVLALIQAMFPVSERPRAFAYFGAAAGMGTIAGQAGGGLLLRLDLFGLGWRGAFLIQLPVGVAALVAGRALIPESRGTGDTRLDLPGTALLTLGLGLVLLPVLAGREQGWPAWTVISLVAAAPVLAVFVAGQRRRPAPLVDPALFRDRAFTAGLLISLAFDADLGSFFFAVTLYLQDVRHDSPLAAGLEFAPLGVSFMIASMLARRLVARYGRRVLTAGTGLVLASLAAGIAVVEAGAPLAPVLLAIGFGNGLVLPALLNVVLAGVDPRRAGAASGVLVTAQQFGNALGVAAIGGLYFATSPAVALAADLGLIAAVLGLTLLLPYGTGRTPKPGAPAREPVAGSARAGT